MSLIRRILYFCVALVIFWSIYLYTNPEKDTIFNYLYGVAQGIVYLIGGLSVLIASLDFKPGNLRRSIIFLSLGSVSWAVASFFWGYFNIFTNIEVPQPSVADALYILYSILTGVGCWYMLRSLSEDLRIIDLLKPFLIIFFVFFAGMVAFGWPEVIMGDSILKVVINLQYPIVDGFLFALAYVMFLQEKSHSKSAIVLLVLSMFFQVLGDVNYLIFESFGIYWNGSFPDMFYMASAFCSSIMLTYLVSSQDQMSESFPLKNSVSQQSK